ncbi:MAG: hypothetical protein EOM50_12535 [Erysipelotrichia bacterium]|nr:hypothetical protein [Erysipelotrichia bacterium]
MFKILLLLFFALNHLLAETFGKDIPVEGVWKIDSAKQGVSVEVAGMIGYNMALKFNSDGSVTKLNHQTLQPTADSRWAWTVKDKGTLHIFMKNENSNFVSDLILKNNTNTYLQLFEKRSDNCYLTALQNGNKLDQWGVIVCKISQ